MDKNTDDKSAIACDLNAIKPEQRGRHGITVEQVFTAVQEMQELPNGYAFRLPQEPDMWLKVAEFIANERLCCPFFGFTLEFEPEGGPLWLKLTGREGVKQYLQAEGLPWKLSLKRAAE